MGAEKRLRQGSPPLTENPGLSPVYCNEFQISRCVSVFLLELQKTGVLMKLYPEITIVQFEHLIPGQQDIYFVIQAGGSNYRRNYSAGQELSSQINRKPIDHHSSYVEIEFKLTS